MGFKKDQHLKLQKEEKKPPKNESKCDWKDGSQKGAKQTGDSDWIGPQLKWHCM